MYTRYIFHCREYPIHYVFRAPHIELNANGQVSTVITVIVQFTAKQSVSVVYLEFHVQ